MAPGNVAPIRPASPPDFIFRGYLTFRENFRPALLHIEHAHITQHRLLSIRALPSVELYFSKKTVGVNDLAERQM